MDLNEAISELERSYAPETAAVDCVLAELRRLQLMEARAKGVASLRGGDLYVKGAATAARQILGESGAPTAPDREPPA